MEYQSENGNVICALCGREFKTITAQHLKKSHNITIADYKQQFPNAALVSERTKAKRKYTSSETFKKEIQPVTVDVEPNLEVEYVGLPNEELDVNEIKNPAKREIFNNLKKKFPNIKSDYNIQKKDMQGNTEYSIITDIADPVNQIDFEFPDTFWHNPGYYFKSPVRENLLAGDKWKVIIFKGKHMSEKELFEKLDKIF